MSAEEAHFSMIYSSNRTIMFMNDCSQSLVHSIVHTSRTQIVKCQYDRNI